MGINTDQSSSANTDEFINQVGFEVVVDDPGWMAYAQFGPGGAASRYIIINGVADSPSHKQWEVLFNETYFQADEVNLLRALIDQMKAPVLTPPKITVQPQSHAAVRGATVELRVSSTGTAPLNYQWNRNGAPIPGATAKSLVLTNVTSGDAAEYSVVVSNFIGSETSHVGIVKVTEPLRPFLSGLRRLDSGAAEFAITGEPGRTYHIEFSVDLKSWKQVASLKIDQPKTVYRDAAAALELQGFYRIVGD